MENLKIYNDYNNVENGKVEIVERKGLGHPDSIADMLAKECSRIYSVYCMEHFGCVLHHNFDKLYIGAGCFRYEDGKVNMYDKIKVFVNGRASNTMNGETIDLEKLLIPVIEKYVGSILPRVNVKTELEINCNSTQNTKMPKWFSPANIDDVPDAKKVVANDTSLCISHYPRSICEDITLKVEQFFWNLSENEYPTPKYQDVGQDIKTMVSRIDKNIDVTVCLPIYSDKFNSRNEYIEIIKKYEKLLTEYIETLNIDSSLNIKVAINQLFNGNYRDYSLIKGSCIECGEEGVVGRGNNSQGLIPAFRSHSMEAPFGKNERYHTGRVLSFVSNNITRRIYEECNLDNSLHCLTRNQNKLLEPFLMYLSVNKELDANEEEIIERIVKEETDENLYLEKILNDKKIY